MSSVEDAGTFTQAGPAAARLSRALLAAMVVLASAGTGYVGSRILPLSSFSDSEAGAPPTETTRSTQPAATASAPPSSAPVSRPAAIPDPIIPFDLPSPSQPSAMVRAPEKAQAQVLSATAGAPDAAVGALYRAPPAQADADNHRTPKAHDRTSVIRRKFVSTRLRRGGQSASASQSSVVEFAPNPRPNQAVRDYMAHPSRN